MLQYLPKNANEALINQILYDNGYNSSEIEFKGDVDERYVRIGYWERLNSKTISQLDSLIEEIVDDGDEDCLPITLYKIK